MWLDSHCHLDFSVFAKDRAVVLSRAQAAGVTDIVIPATTRQSWTEISALCAENPHCHPAYGLHPYFLAQHRHTDNDALADWLQTHHAVAIGEAGLDFAIATDRRQQQHYFIAQLELASALSLPIILHAHRALEQVLQTLKKYPSVRFVIHAFSGSDQQLAQLLDLGGYIGVGGTITYTRAQRLRRQITHIDINRILLETDAPDQPLCNYRGERNEPARIAEIAKTVAELRGQTTEKLSAHLVKNQKSFFHGLYS